MQKFIELIINIITTILKKPDQKPIVNENQPQLDFEKLKDNDPVWLKIAYKELGTSEIAGEKDNKRIIEYHSATSLKAGSDEVAWCSSFVNWVINQCGMEGTNSAAARSWTNWGGQVSRSTPKRGAIAVLKRGSKSWQGHVGFLLAMDEKSIWLLGGNQSNKVCIQKYNASDLITMRWP